MAILIKQRKHLKTRLLPLTILIIIVAFLPMVIGLGGAFFSELITGKPCSNEGNCGWLGFIWYMMFSIPVAFLLTCALALILVIDYIVYNRTKV